jgi:putative flippase GtrA
MPPSWIGMLAAIYVPLSIVAALLVLADIFLAGRRQHMGVMEAVWPLTMLYWGPLGLLFYAWFGRGMTMRPGARMPPHGGGPMWQAAFKGATHCGAGCALGDFIGDWIAFGVGLTLFGSVLGGDYLLAFVLAYLLGVIFQYFSIAPMRKLGLAEGLLAAIKIDTLSLLAYEVGMFAGMAVRAWLWPSLTPTSWSYWLLIQVAMLLGFATTYPVNWWLIRRGIKERM